MRYVKQKTFNQQWKVGYLHFCLPKNLSQAEVIGRPSYMSNSAI